MEPTILLVASRLLGKARRLGKQDATLRLTIYDFSIARILLAFVTFEPPRSLQINPYNLFETLPTTVFPQLRLVIPPW